MKTTFLWMWAALCCAGMAVAQDDTAADAPKSARAAAAQWSADGLERVDVKGLDLVYRESGATLAGYDRVMLGPISVSFDRNWERTPKPGSRFRWSSNDMQRIRDRLTTVLREETASTLAAGGHELVDAPGENVLRVDVKITNLDITSPLPNEQMTDVRVFGVSAGDMTLVAELSDSVSGAVLFRAYDFAEASGSPGFHHRITNAENAAEARKIAQTWAKILLAQLDSAKQQP
jgi:hypothetical protein